MGVYSLFKPTGFSQTLKESRFIYKVGLNWVGLCGRIKTMYQLRSKADGREEYSVTFDLLHHMNMKKKTTKKTKLEMVKS